MKRLLHSLLPLCFSVLFLAGTIGVKPLCWGDLLYQPRVPEALRE